MSIKKIGDDFLIYAPREVAASVDHDEYSGVIVNEHGSVIYTIVESSRADYYGSPAPSYLANDKEYLNSRDIDIDGHKALVIPSMRSGMPTVAEIAQHRATEAELAGDDAGLFGHTLLGRGQEVGPHEDTFGCPTPGLLREMREFVKRQRSGELKNIHEIFPGFGPGPAGLGPTV